MTAESSTCLGCLVNPNWIPPNWQDNFVFEDFLNKLKNVITPKTQSDSVKLNLDESQILNFLKEAWNGYQKLENKSDADDTEFLDAIHRAQQIIALRVARRADPDVWKQP